MNTEKSAREVAIIAGVHDRIENSEDLSPEDKDIAKLLLANYAMSMASGIFDKDELNNLAKERLVKFVKVEK